MTTKVRLVTRVITFDSKEKKVLLVKNRGQDFWYPPGGRWEHDRETIKECAEREVSEETGLKVKVIRLLYVQEFHDAADSISFETVWLARPIRSIKLDEQHIDRDIYGQVEAVRWFSQDELRNMKIFPKRLQNTFWKKIDQFLEDEDPFIEVG